MKRFLHFISIIAFLFFLAHEAAAQGTQTVLNGTATRAINFPGGACLYNWINDTPGIGLAANGTGNIPSFIAVNNGGSPVTATITAAPAPTGYAYIVNYGSGDVSVINLATNTVVTTIPIGAGTKPSGVSVSPDGSRVYIPNDGTNTVSVINTATNKVIATIPVGTLPSAVAVSPDGSKAYVSNIADQTVSVITTSSNKVTATISGFDQPNYLVLSPDGSLLYVANSPLGSFSVVNTSTNTIINGITVGADPIQLAVSPDGSRIYSTNQLSNNVSVMNPATSAVIATIPVGNHPYGEVLSPNGSFLYVGCANDGTVTVINTATDMVVSTINAGANPSGLSITGDGQFVYVTNDVSPGTTTVISTATNTVIATIPVGSYPYSFGSFIVNGKACGGVPVTYTIKVNPTTLSPPAITTGPLTGSISACAGSASATPEIEQFKVSGSNLTSDITVTASAGFEVSLSANGSYANIVAVTQSGGTVSNKVVYVRSAATAAPGNISGKVTLTSTSAKSENVAVTANVNQTPEADAVPNQKVTSGNPTAAINFTGTATAFDWVNDTPSIGLAIGGVGDIPSFIASNPGTTPIIATITVTPVPAGQAYIASISSNSLTVINTATNKVTSTIQVGGSPFGVSVSPDGGHVYVTNQGSNNVSVINTTTNAVETTVPVGSAPSGLLVSRDGSKVYVANSGSGTISVISTKTNTVIATIAAGGAPTAVALNPDGSVLYVTNASGDSVTAINTATNALVQTYLVGTSPLGIAITPDGSAVYVANSTANTVSVINTITNAVTTIPVGADPTSMSISPNGTQVYVSDSGSNDVSVISTLTNLVTTRIPIGSQTFGLSVTPDGNRVFVAAVNSNYISVINTLTNTVIFQIQVGLNPNSLGNFVAEGSSCSGTPITFTITVNPIVRTIVATGALSALTTTYGTASASTSFKVSGTSIAGGILITPPPGFEVSTDNITFSSTVTVGSTGDIAATPVYIRLASTTVVGSYAGNVVLTSAGAPDVNVPTVNSSVTPAALTIKATNVSKAFGAVLTGGTGSTAFTATGLKNAETIGSVSIAYGQGSAASDGAGTYTGAVVPSLPTGGTFTASNYTITFVKGDIIVSPEAPTATITSAGTLSPLNTIYGTPSTSTTFTVSGAYMSAGILITPPFGFEVSTDGIAFSSTVSIGAAGTIAPTPIYIRLASSTHVGSYSNNIVMTSTGANDVNKLMPESTVTPAKLAVIADDKTKTYGQVNPVLTVTYIGFVNNDGPAQLTTQPIITTTALTTSPAGQYPITAIGAASPDYTITPVAGVLTIIPSIVIPNAFTPNGDGINDTWNIKDLDSYVNCIVQIYNRYGENVYSSIGYGVPWDGSYKGAALPTGTYYYIVNLKNGQKVLSGFVAIIR